MSQQTVSESDDKGLVQQLVDKEHALVRARFANSMGRLENTATLKGIRKDIARIRTEIRRREIAQGLAKNALLGLRGTVTVSATTASEAASGGFLQGVVDKLAE